ncbi:MAG: hypothetical protein AABX04_03370 [Nanoarchaeota archaeon]
MRRILLGLIILLLIQSVEATILSEDDFQTLYENADNYWQQYRCYGYDKKCFGINNVVEVDNMQSKINFINSINNNFGGINRLPDNWFLLAEPKANNLGDTKEQTYVFIAFVYSNTSHIFTTKVSHDDDLVIVVDYGIQSEIPYDFVRPFLQNTYKNDQDLSISFKQGWQKVFLITDQADAPNYLYFKSILSSDAQLAIFDDYIDWKSNAEEVENALAERYTIHYAIDPTNSDNYDFRCLFKPLDPLCSNAGKKCGTNQIFVQSYILPDKKESSKGCCKSDQCTWNEACYDYGKKDSDGSSDVCGDNNNWYRCNTEIQGNSGKYVESADGKILTCLPTGWGECTFNQVLGPNKEFFCDSDKRIIPNMPGTSCDSSKKDNVILWSYFLPGNADNFADLINPDRVGCCKSDQCYSSKGCIDFDKTTSTDDSRNMCGKDNNWDICGTEVSETKNTPSDGGKYYCDGTKWILNENCTDTSKDLNGNKLKGCQDPSCKDQIGAYFNSKLLDLTNYKQDKPTCLNKKDDCKCEFGVETKCDDGFDNDGNQPTEYMGEYGIDIFLHDLYPNKKTDLSKVLSSMVRTKDDGALGRVAYSQDTPEDFQIAQIYTNNILIDCFDPNCLKIGAKGPGKATCCIADKQEATCGSDHELHETNCWERGIGGTSGDEDNDALFNCQDPDCNDQLCGGTGDRDKWRCSNQVCTPPPTAGPAPVVKILNITFFTYGDLLQFLHKGTVVKENGDCNSVCQSKKMLCGFAQGGRKTCQDTDSTYCTCYPYLSGAEIKDTPSTIETSSTTSSSSANGTSSATSTSIKNKYINPNLKKIQIGIING